MIYYIIKYATTIFLKIYLGLKIFGKENIPKKGAFIVAANHASYLDPLLLAASFKRPLYFIARDRLLTSDALGWLVKNANTIPVKLHGPNISALKTSLKVLSEGRILTIFPEGTRSKNRQLKKAKPGIGFFVFKTKAPVLPVYIDGSFDAQPRSIRTLRRHPVRVYIGKLIDFSSRYGQKPGVELYQSIGDEIMRDIGRIKQSLANYAGE